MANNFLDSLNKIEYVYNGHYSVKVQMESDYDIIKLIDESYKYVWILGYSEYLNEWTPSSNILFGYQSDPQKVSVRSDNMEILMDTKYFIDLLKEKKTVREYLHIIQTNIKPPYFLDLQKFNGKRKYDMLKQHIDYYFELEQMGDCEQITSSRKEVLEDILNKLQS